MGSTRTPVSSRTSRTAHSWGLSSSSSTPPGGTHRPSSARWMTRIRPSLERTTIRVTATLCRGVVAMETILTHFDQPQRYKAADLLQEQDSGPRDLAPVDAFAAEIAHKSKVNGVPLAVTLLSLSLQRSRVTSAAKSPGGCFNGGRYGRRRGRPATRWRGRSACPGHGA